MLRDLHRRLLARALAGGMGLHERMVRARKQRLLGGLTGRVIEVGAGGGPNLGYLPDDTSWVGLDPNPHVVPYARAEGARWPARAALVTGVGEALPFTSGCADAVVSTMVLCSVADLAATLAEVHRVLRPGGRFVFLEHVAAPRGSWLRLLQAAIAPPWRFLTDGCHPDREVEEALRGAGFAHVECEAFRLPLPIFSPHLAGVATRGE